MDLRRLNMVLESVEDDLGYGYISDAIEKLDELVRITPDVFAHAGLSVPRTRKDAARRAREVLRPAVKGSDPSWITHKRSKAAALAGLPKIASKLGKEAHRNTINPPEHGSKHELETEAVKNKHNLASPQKDEFDLDKYLSALAAHKTPKATRTEADSMGRPYSGSCSKLIMRQPPDSRLCRTR